MLRIYDACKIIGAEEFYKNFVYDNKNNTIYVIELALDKKRIREFLSYINQNVALETVGIVITDSEKEYLPIASYRLCGKKMTTNKNPKKIDAPLLEELIKQKERCQKVASDFGRLADEIIAKQEKEQQETGYDECEESDLDFD